MEPKYVQSKENCNVTPMPDLRLLGHIPQLVRLSVDAWSLADDQRSGVPVAWL